MIMGVFEELRDFFDSKKTEPTSSENQKNQMIKSETKNKNNIFVAQIDQIPQTIVFNLISRQKKQHYEKNNLLSLTDAEQLTDENISKNKSENASAFIDGGSSEIIGASTFSLQQLRVAVIEYVGIQRIGIKRKDFFCLAKIKDLDKIKIKFEALDAVIENKSDLEQELIITAGDISTKREDDRIYGVETYARKAISSARRLLELKAVISELKSQSKPALSLVVLDGALDYINEEEKKVIKNIRSLAMEKNILVLGISKTSTAYCGNGIPVGMFLSKEAESRNIVLPWIYFGIETDSELNTYAGFIKFSETSKNFVFRIDYFSEQKELLKNKEIVDILRKQSTDAVFSGYPYGLIEADEEARITNGEIEEAYAQLMIVSGDKWDELQKASSSVNAHSILDLIKF